MFRRKPEKKIPKSGKCIRGKTEAEKRQSPPIDLYLICFFFFLPIVSLMPFSSRRFFIHARYVFAGVFSRLPSQIFFFFASPFFSPSIYIFCLFPCFFPFSPEGWILAVGHKFLFNKRKEKTPFGQVEAILHKRRFSPNPLGREEAICHKLLHE